MNEDVWSFLDFKKINPDMNVWNYLYSLVKENSLPVDLYECAFEMIYPDFYIMDECIFILNMFNMDKYIELQKQNVCKKEIQFWMNLMEITSIHEDITEERALILANKIASSWNAKIKYENVNENGIARVIHDKEYGEVFVTIDL